MSNSVIGNGQGVLDILVRESFTELHNDLYHFLAGNEENVVKGI